VPSALRENNPRVADAQSSRSLGVDGSRKGTYVETKNNKIEQLVLHPELFLMDIPTAAARMSTTVFAVRELCRSGQLKFVPIGHKWLISPGAIQDFIDRKEQEARVAA
jgi:hypothetical protein